MSFDSDFKTLGNTTVTVANLSTRGAFGEPTFATGVSYNARVSEINRMVTEPSGQTVVLTHEVWILSTKSNQSNITSESVVTLSGGTDKLRVIQVERPPDEDGLHHTKLFLGDRGAPNR